MKSPTEGRVLLRFLSHWLVATSLLSLLGATDYSHRVWRTEDGLPHNGVRALAQTADGYLWVGTTEGLARFDGVRFLTFDRSNTPALTDNSILSLEAVPDGSLWIGTEGGGLLHYSGSNFQRFGQKDNLTNGFIRATHLDRARTLWVGTDRGFFRSSKDGFLRLDGTPEVPLASVVSIAEDGLGKIWVSSSSGLLEVDEGVLKRTQCQNRTAIASGLTVSLIRERLIPNGCAVPPFTLPNLSITSLHRDASGNLWIGTIGSGLLSLNSTGNANSSHVSPLLHPDNTILLLFEDRQHNIWAGAQDGLLRLSRAAVSTIGAAQGLADENVSTTYEDLTGKLWIVTFSGQIYTLKGSTTERYYLPMPLRDLRFRTVFMDSKGAYWFGAAGAGVVRLSEGKAIHYTRKDGLHSDSIRQIFEDSRGMVWLATSSGLSSWNGKTFTNYYLEQGLSYPSVRYLAEAPDGDILAGTDAGLNRIHDGHIIVDQAFAGLKQEKIWSIYVDGKNLWLGTRGAGLVLIRDGRTTRFTTKEGLVSNSIYQIVDDRAGRLWLSSPVGVFSVRRAELDAIARGANVPVHAVAYGTSDGMATGQMNGGLQPAGCRRSSGELWFPTARGAVKLDPTHLPERTPGPVLIESISASDSPLPLSSEVVVPAGRGRLQIDFTACDLIAPQQVSFRYKLEGFDDAWTTTTHSRSAYYSNLPPGHYKFRVVAEDTGAASAFSEAFVSIYRKPEFLQSGLFYSLLSAFLLCCLWAGLWLYARQTKARYALLLTERTRLAREMHDTVIQGCVGVSTLLEAVARFQRSNSTEASQLLAHARSQIKETLEEARQAVWDLRHSNENQSSIIHLFDLARKLGNEYGVNVETEIEGERIPLDWLTDRTLLLVGREALRNSVSHGNPDRISVRIAFDAERVSMAVRDDGKGFNPDVPTQEPNRSFGIIGMRERVEQLGGSFALHSRPGQGTVVTASLPALQNSTMPR
jgi:ligand-binding sensor domain-containing protein/signal transduction histidine kinase